MAPSSTERLGGSKPRFRGGGWECFVLRSGLRSRCDVRSIVGDVFKAAVPSFFGGVGAGVATLGSGVPTVGLWRMSAGRSFLVQRGSAVRRSVVGGHH